MKHQFLSIILLIMIICSCNSGSENNDLNLNNESTSKPATVIDVTGCYIQVSGRDTILAIMEQNGNKISGNLKFDNYQIDGSSGTLTGVLEKDILKLKYDFFSEGMNSTMDIYFKYKNNSLIRGVGNMKTSGDSTLFIDASSINYSNETILHKVNCSEVTL